LGRKIDRTGEIKYNNQGLKMWIKDYRCSKDIDVEFEDGCIIANREYSDFKKKNIKNPNFKYVNSSHRIGEINVNNQGLKMIIKNYKGANSIDVKFEDGYIAYDKQYNNFKRGEINNPNFNSTQKINRKGEKSYNNQGLKMWIKEYRGADDVDIEFEDSFISYNKQYYMFKKGSILNPNFKNPQTIDRIDETGNNNYGSKMTIIKYNSNRDITVKFDNGYIKKSNYTAFKNGQVKSPYCKSVCEVGYTGEGKYKVSKNGSHTEHYKYWVRMLNRCYDKKTQEKHMTYIGCTVCDEWHNFQNFKKWYDENIYMVEGQRMELDKDILVKGNKLYSPDNCIFVPQRINSLFVKNDADRGKCPIGVCYDNTQNKYRTTYAKENVKVHVGSYNNIDIAFNSYKTEKEKYIKQVADEYKDKIPETLYNAMYRWIVEITD
jgi:hypothetical protein